MLLECIISLYCIINSFVLTGFTAKIFRSQSLRKSFVADPMDTIQWYTFHPCKKGSKVERTGIIYRLNVGEHLPMPPTSIRCAQLLNQCTAFTINLSDIHNTVYTYDEYRCVCILKKKHIESHRSYI